MAQTPQTPSYTWEVLNGVGVDGVGGIFPFFFSFFFAFSFFFVFLRFSSFFFAFLRFSSLFFVFLRFSLVLSEDKGKRLQFTAKMGNFTPTPSAPTPCKTSRYTPIAALSTVWSVSQRSRSYTRLKGPCRCPSRTSLLHLSWLLGGGGCSTATCEGCRGKFGPPKPCRARGGGAATLASVTLHFDTNLKALLWDKRVSAEFCGFLQNSAISCRFLRKAAPPKCCKSAKISKNQRKSVKICENLRMLAPFVPFSLSLETELPPDYRGPRLKGRA